MVLASYVGVWVNVGSFGVLVCAKGHFARSVVNCTFFLWFYFLVCGFFSVHFRPV